MKYISLDLETTGLDPKNHQILEVGAILEDTEKKLPREKCPQFHAILDQKEIVGQPYALNMNANLLKILAELDDLHYTKKGSFKRKHNIVKPEEVVKKFRKWYWTDVEGKDSADFDFFQSKLVRFNVAGKNFGTFDLQFLKELPFWGTKIECRNRIIDPAVAFIDWKEDKALPNMETCKARAKHTEGIVVTHNALDDAWDIIQMMRQFY